MKHPFQKPYPLEHQGTSQSERQAPALPPHTLAIDGRNRDQLIAFGRRLAAHIRFATPFGNEGNWSPLFELLENPDSLAEAHDAPPQAALFLAFIKLFEKAQGELNRLSKSHLDYYYRELLQLAPKPAQADHVNLLFEARPKRDQVTVAAGTVFTAGDLRYATDRNVWINRTTIEHLCSLYREPASSQLHFALQSNSLDGLGAALPKEQPAWPAFGHTGIPKATVGFALASPLLQLSSGKRTITASLRLELGDEDPPLNEAAKSLLIEFSGEKGWLGPFSAQSVEITESSDNWLLQFVVVLDAETEAVSAYDAEVLDGGFVTTLPLMKISVSPDTPALREWLEQHDLVDMQLLTKVENAGELVAENDLGRLDTGKPFLPFGPQPKTGSTFAVASPEMLNKQVTSFSLNLNWKGVPAKRLSDHYSAYRFNSSGQPCGTDDCIGQINNNNAFSAQMILEREDSSRIERKIKLFDNSDATLPQTLISDEPPARLIPLTGLNYFYMPLQTHSSFSALPWAGFNMISSFSLLPLNLIARKAATPSVKELQGVNRPGYIKLRLERDFLHQYYPIVLAKSMAQDSGMAIPNPPYTPELESVQLTYEAQTGWVDPTDGNAAAYIGAEIRLYQTTPFGQREVHGFLKSQLDASINDKIRLLPDSSPEGQLFIGLREQPDTAFLDLLIQVDEGSANPEKNIETVIWSLLESDHWRDLTEEEILFDESNGLLTSGILRVNIPARPPQTNHWMPQGLIWLRARVENNSDAVCHLIDLHPQAASAHLLEAGKNPPHLTSALPPKSIGKAVKSLDGIKGASQPYASICGQAKESDQTFYTRVSERLRHKQRAVTLWDYERLVLQAFPELYRVKCLPHLPGPGHVSLVVIPDIRQRKAYDPLQPRIDKDTESRIDKLLAALNSTFASAKVFNPDYEKIRLDIAVAFKPEYPFGAASQALQKALQQHLAPWTGDATTMPAFGGRIHKSMLLAFIMDQPSVDYVQQLKLYHLPTEETPEIDRDEVVSQNPKAILTSHHQHTIRDAASGGSS
ncbi:MAG: baseplate J/gp47 family protein [Chromatiales bacterium]|nr:baseplate J/gp47 family protein [Gammaproteobacteria bacterium]